MAAIAETLVKEQLLEGFVEVPQSKMGSNITR
jgi:hypothetical protein